jgi:Carbohydrate esterase, sialic acid-specific acetylesterase
VAISIADPPPNRLEYAFWSEIQASQNSLTLPCLRGAKASGLSLKDDGIHLTTHAQHQLGVRIAEEMKQLRRRLSCR